MPVPRAFRLSASFRRAALYTGVIALCFALAAAVGNTRILSVSGTPRDLPIYSVERPNKVVSLTFDAAWGNEDTEALIEILGRYGVRATFFVVGEWAERYPESVRALHDAGHEVMNHSDTHPHMTKLSRAEMLAQVSACDDKVEALTGVRPILFRPPYGDYDNALVGAMRDSGHYTIQWDVDSLDWKDPPPEAIASRVLERAREGSIILFHNAAKNTPAALPSVIEGLIARDHEGRQISAPMSAGSSSDGGKSPSDTGGSSDGGKS